MIKFLTYFITLRYLCEVRCKFHCGGMLTISLLLLLPFLGIPSLAILKD